MEMELPPYNKIGFLLRYNNVLENTKNISTEFKGKHILIHDVMVCAWHKN